MLMLMLAVTEGITHGATERTIVPWILVIFSNKDASQCMKQNDINGQFDATDERRGGYLDKIYFGFKR